MRTPKQLLGTAFLPILSSAGRNAVTIGLPWEELRCVPSGSCTLIAPRGSQGLLLSETVHTPVKLTAAVTVEREGA